MAIGILLWAEVQAHPTELSPALFEGTGRACSGTLSIRSKSISWTTPFSRCNDLPYELLEQSINAGKIRYTFRLTRIVPTCRYRVLSLTHNKALDANTGWEITGYGQEQSYQADKASEYTTNATDRMSCYLIRAPANAKRQRE